MAYTPFYIAQYEENSGLNTYFEPFLTPERAFPVLEDAYCWRGRVKRREGNLFLGRLRIVLNNFVLPKTLMGSTLYFELDILHALRGTEPNAEIEEQSIFYLTIDPGGANQTTISDIGHPGILRVVAGPLTLAVDGLIAYQSGTISLTFSAPFPANLNVTIDFAYFPALPCMGLRQRENPNINTEDTIAFDTKYAYIFDPTLPRISGNNFDGEWKRLPSVLDVVWTGDTTRYFWSTNYYHSPTRTTRFWVTNNNPPTLAPPSVGDRLYTWDGNTWLQVVPIVNTNGNTLLTCLCILPFKSRLVLFNTTEFDGVNFLVFPNRIRWSSTGNPEIPANWQDDPGLGGGFIDLPTAEKITSVEALKDLILIKCETSSWKLLYSGNDTDPFYVQKLDDNFGSESTFNLIPFNDRVLCISNYGILADDSTQVERIDIEIPDQAFTILNTGTPVRQISRVYGIRDYVRELVYWSYPDRNLLSATTDNFCNKLLVYNYRNNSYARFNDSYTCFGPFQYFSIHGNLTNDSIANVVETVAGNQQGFTMVLGKQTLNGDSLAISGINAGPPLVITCVDHNLYQLSDWWIKIEGIVGTGAPGSNPTELNYSVNPRIFHLTRIQINTFQLETWNTLTQTFSPVTLAPGGLYLGAGQISILQNFDLKTKVFAPFYEQGNQVNLGYIDYLLDKTGAGKLTSNVFINEDPNPPINDSAFGSNKGLLGSNVLLTSAENAALIPMQGNQLKIWHRQFIQSFCQNFQIELKMNNDQMSSIANNDNTFVLHAITLYLSQNARMIQ